MKTLTCRREPLNKGYTLIELIVAVGLFAIVVTLATGAYLVMIGMNRQTQGLATGINGLAFVLESMTIAMRTGTKYACNGLPYPSDCVTGGSSFSLIDQNGKYVAYGLAGGAIVTCTSILPTTCSPNIPLTAPAVNIPASGLRFYVSGTTPGSGDGLQPYVTITVSGTVEVAPGKTKTFSIESGAAMRGTDI